MSVRAFAAFVFACCAMSRVSDAQQVEAVTGRLLFAAGTEAIGFRDGAVIDPALSLHFGYERPLGNSRVGIRLAGSFTGNAHNNADSESYGRFYGAGLFSTYALSTARALRPYLIAGAGIERLSTTRTLQRVGDSGARSVSLVGQSSASLSGGAGLLSRLGPASVFAETRLTWFPGGSQTRRAAIPILVGLRF